MRYSRPARLASCGPFYLPSEAVQLRPLSAEWPRSRSMGKGIRIAGMSSADRRDAGASAKLPDPATPGGRPSSVTPDLETERPYACVGLTKERTGPSCHRGIGWDTVLVGNSEFPFGHPCGLAARLVQMNVPEDSSVDRRLHSGPPWSPLRLWQWQIGFPSGAPLLQYDWYP